MSACRECSYRRGHVSVAQDDLRGVAKYAARQAAKRPDLPQKTLDMLAAARADLDKQRLYLAEHEATCELVSA